MGPGFAAFAYLAALPPLRAAMPGLAPADPAWLAIGIAFGLAVGLAMAGAAVFFHFQRRIERMNRDLANYEAALGIRFAALERALANQAAAAPAATLHKLQPGIQPPEPKAAEDNVIPLNTVRAGSVQEKRMRLNQVHVEEAVRDNRIMAWFQPIVTLPGRKTVYLAAQAHLETGNGQILPPDQWLKTAARAGLGAQVDKQIALTCLRAARELRRGEKECGVVWPLSPAILTDDTQWEEIANLLKANRSLGPLFVCAIDLADFRSLGHVQLDRLYFLREQGFRLALHGCDDMRHLSDALRPQIFGMAFVPAEVLAASGLAFAAGPQSGGGPDTDFVATGVADEDAAIALLDRDVTFAMGALFAPARPLKSGIRGNAANNPAN